MITVTLPGRIGDIIWGLPTVRAIADANGPVRIHIPGEFAGLVPILQQQPYVADVTTDPTWSISQPESWRSGLSGSDVLELGYRGWPERPLPQETWAILRREYPQVEVGVFDLQTPWIHIPMGPVGYDISCGFSEPWFELKLGVLVALRLHLTIGPVLCPRGGRWDIEGRQVVRVKDCDLATAAEWIEGSPYFFADCSALHVLAYAMGKTVVVLEPMEARWQDVFWPLGMDGPRIWCVKGGDGKPTFDARHTRDLLLKVLASVREGSHAG